MTIQVQWFVFNKLRNFHYSRAEPRAKIDYFKQIIEIKKHQIIFNWKLSKEFTIIGGFSNVSFYINFIFFVINSIMFRA